MPSFVIPDGPTSVEASRSSDATVTYNVTNNSSGTMDARLSVIPTGGSSSDWFSIDGNRERTFGAGETQTVTIRVKIPGETPGGEYPFRLRAVAVNDPDNDHAEGPVTVARLAGTGGGSPSRLWLWILLGVLALAVIGAGLYFVLRPHETATAPAPPPGPTAIDDATARQQAEMQVGEWVKAVNAGDVKTLVGLADPPFFFDNGLVYGKDEIAKRYAPMAQDEEPPMQAVTADGTPPAEPQPAARPREHIIVTKLTAYTIADLKKVQGFDPATDRAYKSLDLKSNDIAVVLMTQGDGILFYFRRSDKGVTMAGFWN
jgi:hypothetical protein